MKSRFFPPRAVFVFSLLAGVAIASGQQPASQANNVQRVHYTVTNLGTFGGPSSQVFGGYAQAVNLLGTTAGQADTSVANPNYPMSNPYINIGGPSAVIQKAFRRVGSNMVKLESIGGARNARGSWVNDLGWIAGVSENGATDPRTGWPEGVAVLWKNTKPIVLGTFGGSESVATAVNDRGQVVGFAANTVRDPYPSPLFQPGYLSQQRAFLWQNGKMQDLGTLGGPDAAALLINNAGQIAGVSYTNNHANDLTGVPTVDPFFWSNGKMVDIGTLGGTVGSPNWLNARGQVVGVSDLKGDLVSHPFLWQKGKLQDLGTLGGSYGVANFINDLGVVVGSASTAGDRASIGFLWRSGKMSSLGTLPGDACSAAYGINLWGQVVGSSGSCYSAMQHAFLWANGKMIDLNSFVTPGSGIRLSQPVWINELGQIAVNGTDIHGQAHAFLLTPDKVCLIGCAFSR